MVRRAVFGLAAVLFLAAGSARADFILYAGVGAQAPNVGTILTLDQSSGASQATPVGPPMAGRGLSGLAVDAAGNLWASAVQSSVDASTLIQINPSTGAQIGSGAAITFGSAPITISDLSYQPGTGILYGLRSAPGSGGGTGNGRLYTINTSTGDATFIGETGATPGAIAFAPDGTLYRTAFVSSTVQLLTINPTTGATIGTPQTITGVSSSLNGLDVRPSDGLLFASVGGTTQSIFTIDPTTFVATALGTTMAGTPGDLAFAPVPEPGSLALLGLAAAGAVLRSVRRRASS